jgi:hypothetical protein
MTLRTLESHLACLIGGLAAGVLIMWGAGQDKAVKAELKGAQSAITYDRKADAITATVGQAAAEKVIQVQYRTREVIKLVPSVITPEIVERYPLPNAFVRLHDAAVLQEVPAATWELDGSPSDVGADQALGTIVGNVGQCYQWREQLIGLQTWVKQQLALSESTSK